MAALLRSVFFSVLVFPLSFAFAYVAAITAVLMLVGYWEVAMLKTTVLWFFGTALGTLFNRRAGSPDFLRKLISHNVALAAFIEFIVNLYTFPLLLELVFVPLVTLLACLQALGRTSREFVGKPKYDLLRNTLSGCLSVIGLLILAYTITETIQHWRDLVQPEQVKEFFLPLVLVVTFIPYLYLWQYIAALQTTLHMTKYGLGADNQKLFQFARARIIAAIGLDIQSAELFEREFRYRLWGATTEEEVVAVLDAFRGEQKKHRIGWAKGRTGHEGSFPPDGGSENP